MYHEYILYCLSLITIVLLVYPVIRLLIDRARDKHRDLHHPARISLVRNFNSATRPRLSIGDRRYDAPGMMRKLPFSVVYYEKYENICYKDCV